MPKGRGRGGKTHKGQRRIFSNPEQEEARRLKNQKEKAWNKARGAESDESSEEEEGATSTATADQPRDLPPRDFPESESSEEETDSEDEEVKPKGVAHLIEIENPNRVQKKTKKVTDLDPSVEKPELSRREREALEKERAKENYEKLRLQGKTEEARTDLARLAIIKKQREEAARKREQEKQMKDTKAKK